MLREFHDWFPGAHGRIRRRELRPAFWRATRPINCAAAPALVQEVYGKCVELLEARGLC